MPCACQGLLKVVQIISRADERGDQRQDNERNPDGRTLYFQQFNGQWRACWRFAGKRGMVTGGLRSGGRPFECQVATVDIHVFERIPAASEQKYEPADDKKNMPFS